MGYKCPQLCNNVTIWWKFFIRRVLAPIMAGSAAVLIITIGGVYFNRMVPFLCENDYNFRFFFHTSMGMYVMPCILFNFVRCIATDPGTIPKEQGAILDEFATRARDEQRQKGKKYRLNIKEGVFFGFCRICNSVKPPRTHHCSVSNKCVASFDHFCPWVMNTVGHCNYHYFLLFMFHLWLGCVYVFTVTCLMMRAYPDFEFSMGRLEAYDIDEVVIGITFGMTASVIIGVGGLLGAHAYLVLTNQTTVEYFANTVEARLAAEEGRTWKNPFDKGPHRNLRRVCGHHSLLRMLFVPTMWVPPMPDWDLGGSEADLMYV